MVKVEHYVVSEIATTRDQFNRDMQEKYKEGYRLHSFQMGAYAADIIAVYEHKSVAATDHATRSAD